jgi:hypothetical protein
MRKKRHDPRLLIISAKLSKRRRFCVQIDSDFDQHFHVDRKPSAFSLDRGDEGDFDLTPFEIVSQQNNWVDVQALKTPCSA